MQGAQVAGLDPDVVPGPAGRSTRGLIVDIEPAGADLHEHVAGAAEVAVEDHLAAELLAPPRDRGVDVAREDVDVVQVGSGR